MQDMLYKMAKKFAKDTLKQALGPDLAKFVSRQALYALGSVQGGLAQANTLSDAPLTTGDVLKYYKPKASTLSEKDEIMLNTLIDTGKLYVVKEYISGQGKVMAVSDEYDSAKAEVDLLLRDLNLVYKLEGKLKTWGDRSRYAVELSELRVV